MRPPIFQFLKNNILLFINHVFFNLVTSPNVGLARKPVMLPSVYMSEFVTRKLAVSNRTKNEVFVIYSSSSAYALL